MKRYSVLLIPDPEDGGYTVTVPTLPGCITEGDTLAEALTNAREVITLHLEALSEAGEPIPQEIAPPELVPVEV